MPDFVLGTGEVLVTTPALPIAETIPPTDGVLVSTPTPALTDVTTPASIVEVSTPPVPSFETVTPGDGTTVLVGPGIKGDPGRDGTGGIAVPTELLAAEVFAIPDRRQALFHIPITYGAGASITTGVNAALVSV